MDRSRGRTEESNFSDPLEKDGVGGAKPMERPDPEQESPESSQRNIGESDTKSAASETF